MTRVAVLEAKVRLISLMLKGTIGVVVSGIVAYFFRG